MTLSTTRNARRTVDPQLVEYLVIVVPGADDMEVVLDAVEQLAQEGRTVVLDAAVVAHDCFGELGISDLPGAGSRPCLNEARVGVLSERDLELIADAIGPGSLGLVVVVEDTWAQPLADAARSVRGSIAGGERIPAAHLQSVLPNLRAPVRTMT